MSKKRRSQREISNLSDQQRSALSRTHLSEPLKLLEQSLEGTSDKTVMPTLNVPYGPDPFSSPSYSTSTTKAPQPKFETFGTTYTDILNPEFDPTQSYITSTPTHIEETFFETITNTLTNAYNALIEDKPLSYGEEERQKEHAETLKKQREKAEDARKLQEVEDARKQKEHAETLKKQREEDARKQKAIADEEQREEEARKLQEAKDKTEEEARKLQEEDERKEREEEDARKLQEVEEARKLQEEDERKQREEEDARKLQEVEDARLQKAEDEARLKVIDEEIKQLKAVDDARLQKAEDEARLKTADEARKRAPKILALDWDQTTVSTHSGGILIHIDHIYSLINMISTPVIKKEMNDIKRVLWILKELGWRIYIVSRADKKSLEEYIKNYRVGLIVSNDTKKSLITDVYGSDNYADKSTPYAIKRSDKEWTFIKKKFLNDILISDNKKFNKSMTKADVYFYDDTSINVYEAKSEFINSRHVNPKGPATLIKMLFEDMALEKDDYDTFNVNDKIKEADEQIKGIDPPPFGEQKEPPKMDIDEAKLKMNRLIGKWKYTDDFSNLGSYIVNIELRGKALYMIYLRSNFSIIIKTVGTKDYAKIIIFKINYSIFITIQICNVIKNY